MAGYISPSNVKSEGISYNALIYCKTNIGGYFFDGFMSLTHSSELTVTSNPVETGAAIVDHAYVMPAKLTVKVMMSDVHESIVSGQFKEKQSRSVSAWNVLKKIQSERIPVSVMTRLWQYDNMLISSLSATEDSKTVEGLAADVVLTEIPVARVRKLKISRAPQTTVDTEMGKVEVQNVVRTALASLASGVGSFSDLLTQMFTGGM